MARGGAPFHARAVRRSSSPAIGIGYFAVEIALLQRFGLFLGHPNYALSVVLAALLVTSGAGALASPRLPGGEASVRWTSYALAGVVLLEKALALPLLPRLAGLGFGLRVMVVFVLVAPIGLLLGRLPPPGAGTAQGRGARPRAVGVGAQRDLLRPRSGVRRRLLGDVGHRGAPGGRHPGLPRRGLGASRSLDPGRPPPVPA